MASFLHFSNGAQFCTKRPIWALPGCKTLRPWRLGEKHPAVRVERLRTANLQTKPGPRKRTIMHNRAQFQGKNGPKIRNEPKFPGTAPSKSESHLRLV